jgi:hypothetical protein
LKGWALCVRDGVSVRGVPQSHIRRSCRLRMSE